MFVLVITARLLLRQHSNNSSMISGLELHGYRRLLSPNQVKGFHCLSYFNQCDPHRHL